MASVATIQLRCCDMRAATEDTERNVRGRVPVKLYLQTGSQLRFANLFGRKKLEKEVVPLTPD